MIFLNTSCLTLLNNYFKSVSGDAKVTAFDFVITSGAL